MTDTTLTFSSLASQAPVKFIDDPSKPGWGEDFVSSKEIAFTEIQLSGGNSPSRPDETDHLLRSKENAAHLKRSIEQHRSGEVYPRPSASE